MIQAQKITRGLNPNKKKRLKAFKLQKMSQNESFRFFSSHNHLKLLKKSKMVRQRLESVNLKAFNVFFYIILIDMNNDQENRGIQIQPSKVLNRPRQLEYNRCLSKIETNDEFIKLDNQEKSIERILTVKKASTQKIMIPDNFTVIQDNIQLNSNKRINYDCYQRINKNQNLPLEEYYECNAQDLDFINQFNTKFELKLTIENFQKIILTFEQNSTKYNQDNPYVKNLVKDFIDQHIFQKIDEIYDYWKSQTENLKRFLIRKFSHPSIDDQNACLAFRPREKDKMKLRRNNRANDQENLQKFKQLRKELETSIYIIKCIQLRENYKNLLKFLNKYNIDENEDSIQQDYNSVIEQFQKLRINYNKLSKDIKNFIQPQKLVQQEEIKQDVQTKIDIVPFDPPRPTFVEEVKKEEKNQSFNILQFKIRKLQMGGRQYLDRYQITNDDEDFPKEFYKSQMKNKHNFLQQKKLKVFEYLYDSSDDDESLNDSMKTIKKKIQKEFKNFQKNRRNNNMIFD